MDVPIGDDDGDEAPAAEEALVQGPHTALGPVHKTVLERQGNHSDPGENKLNSSINLLIQTNKAESVKKLKF